MNQKKSECGRAIKTMCLGQCHAAVGARKERWQGDFASLSVWLGVSIRERSDKELRLKKQKCMGEDSLASCGHGDVEIKFYIPSCFIVPFTREQVQGYSNLPLLVKSHQNELHSQSV